MSEDRGNTITGIPETEDRIQINYGQVEIQIPAGLRTLVDLRQAGLSQIDGRKHIKFGGVELIVPPDKEAVTVARKLIDMLDDEICKENSPPAIKQVPATSEVTAEQGIPAPAAAGDSTGKDTPQTDSTETSKEDLPEKKDPESPPDNTASEETKYVFKEMERFPWKELPMHKIGRNLIYLDLTKARICREGYAEGFGIFANLTDIRYLQEHPEIREEALAELTKFKRSIMRQFLKEVDANVLVKKVANDDKEDEKYKPMLKGAFSTKPGGNDYEKVEGSLET